MSEPKHTPGPWDFYSVNGHMGVTSEDGTEIVEESLVSTEAGEANLRLIAAAPDMYRVIQRFATVDFMGEAELSQWVKECRKIMEALSTDGQTTSVGDPASTDIEPQRGTGTEVV